MAENGKAIIYEFPSTPLAPAIEPADDNTITTLIMNSAMLFVWGTRKTVRAAVMNNKPGAFIDFNGFAMDRPGYSMPLTVNRDLISLVGTERPAAELIAEVNEGKRRAEEAIAEAMAEAQDNEPRLN